MYYVASNHNVECSIELSGSLSKTNPDEELLNVLESLKTFEASVVQLLPYQPK
jgi:hypothetical protein